MSILRDYFRMCGEYSKCSDCEICKQLDDMVCGDAMKKFPDECEKIIDEWCKTHINKSYKTDFLEKFPNAPLTNQEHPMACRVHIYGGNNLMCDYNCKKCWNEEMKDD